MNSETEELLSKLQVASEELRATVREIRQLKARSLEQRAEVEVLLAEMLQAAERHGDASDELLAQLQHERRQRHGTC